MEWYGLIDLAQDRDQWKAVIKKFGLHKMLGNPRVTAHLAAPQEGLSSMELVGLHMELELR
jgi:hypothetical protein